MHQQHDPKVIIARVKAQEKLKLVIQEASKDIGKIVRNHRGRITLMMKDGTIRTGVIKLATFEVFVFDDDLSNHTRHERVEVKDVSDIELG